MPDSDHPDSGCEQTAQQYNPCHRPGWSDRSNLPGFHSGLRRSGLRVLSIRRLGSLGRRFPGDKLKSVAVYRPKKVAVDLIALETGIIRQLLIVLSPSRGIAEDFPCFLDQFEASDSFRIRIGIGVVSSAQTAVRRADHIDGSVGWNLKDIVVLGLLHFSAVVIGLAKSTTAHHTRLAESTVMSPILPVGLDM